MVVGEPVEELNGFLLLPTRNARNPRVHFTGD
ncbi:MAG: hypothetical protein RL261_652, partial [Pseudomonadota bacterium]